MHVWQQSRESKLHCRLKSAVSILLFHINNIACATNRLPSTRSCYWEVSVSTIKWITRRWEESSLYNLKINISNFNCLGILLCVDCKRLLLTFSVRSTTSGTFVVLQYPQLMRKSWSTCKYNMHDSLALALHRFWQRNKWKFLYLFSNFTYRKWIIWDLKLLQSFSNYKLFGGNFSFLTVMSVCLKVETREHNFNSNLVTIF